MVAHQGCWPCEGGEYREDENMAPKESASDDTLSAGYDCCANNGGKPHRDLTVPEAHTMVAYDGYWPCEGGEYREDENMTHKESASDDKPIAVYNCCAYNVGTPHRDLTVIPEGTLNFSYVDDSGPSHQDRDWPMVVDNCDKPLSNTTPGGALKDIVKKDEPDMKALKYMLECAPQVKGDVLEIAVTTGNQEIVSLLLNRGADPNHFSRSDVYTGFILGIAVKDERMDIMKLLPDKGADIKEGFVLGCFAGTDGVHQIKILLHRPGHTKTKTVSTCSFICIWITLDIHFEKAGQVQDDSISKIVLRASMKHSIFDDGTSKWTSDDQPVFDSTCWLQNYKIQLNASCIHTKGKTNVYDQNLHCTEIVKDLIMHIFDKRISQLVTDPDPESDFKSEFETQAFQMTKRHTKRLKPMLYSSQIEKQKLPYDENDVKEIDTSAFDRCLHFWKNNTERLFAIWHSEEQMAEAFDWCLQRTKINYKRLFVTWHLAQLLEEQECDTFNTDSIQLESTSDEECSNRNKLLPSKTALEDDDDTVVQIEKEDSFGCEQIIRFTEMNKRLETYIQWSLSNIDCDLFAEAGFFYTGEKLVCFCCNVCIVDLPLDDPWMQHTFNSPGCDYVKSKKGQEYIQSVLSQSKERKDRKHSKNHPDDAKSQTDLLVEKKYLDPPDLVPDITVCDAESPQRGTDVCSVQKHSSFGRLKLFDVIKGDRKLTISLETPKKYEFIVKKLLKQLCDTAIHESKEGPTHKLMREWKETPECIRHLHEFSLETRNQNHVHVYMVPDVMSRISSYQVWPHRNIRTGPLVEAGFTCKDPNNTTVECKSCGLELIASTLNGTNPTQYHREKSPECEFFNQTNSQSRHGNRALTDQAPSQSGANQEAAHSLVQQSPGNNQQNKSGQAQAGKTSIANDTSAQTRRGSNDGNIRRDDANATTNRQLTRNASSLFSNNGAASFDSLASERPRTEEVSERTGVTVPNNNNTTSGGEAVRENENIIPGAQGGEVPYPIRNPRFTEQHARRESFTHWPHRAAHDIVNLVNAGFFYTGAEDIVRCFYCDIGLAEWTQDDDPWIEHARHSPECPYLRDQKGQDFINNIQTQWARIYTPKHPEYSQINVRRRSYENAGWPRDNVLQTPEQLAAAGFFYTGDGDTVRCHYCDGGLREWEPADDPWVEHARWFPFCKFVLKIKGIDFIQAAATGNPANGVQAPVAPPVAPQIIQAPLTLSFVDRCRIKEQKNPMHSAAAQSLKTMGYSTETRRFVIDTFVAQTGRRDFKAADLMDIIMTEEEKGRVFPESDGEDNDADTGATAGTAAAGGVNTIGDDEEMEFSPAAMRKENEVLKQKFKCKVCGQRERCIVFVPCGHRITCERCGDEAITCSHCNCKIDQRFKTYLG